MGRSLTYRWLQRVGPNRQAKCASARRQRSSIHSDFHGCLRNQPLKLGKAGALRGARIRRPPGLQRQPPAAPPHPRAPLPRRAHAPSHPIPGPGAPRSRRCLKGPQPDFQVGSASGPGAAGPVRMREARAASGVTAVPTVVLETGPLRLGKAGALRGGAWVSGLRGSCLTSPRGRQERLRTDAGSRNAPARMTKPQAESGGSGASSQPQARPDGVGVRLGGNFWRVGWC
ncbi:uncharacterized protein [Macaca nemestrina]|uniref:uncharacterized protein n=1 Tax=Macaca nemestrina TaxID=9545 RepID=UPI0039B8CFED